MLEKRLQQERRFAARRVQREQAVQATGLEIVRETVEKLIQRIQAESPRTAIISERLTAPLAGERLASYRLGDESATLTVDGWRERFNALFVRELPTSTAQLEASVRDLVVAEYTAREARGRGLDREPRFVEDRRNFTYYQALDLFEKEKLLPQIEVTPAETEAYYREHRSEFSRPVRAKGKLLPFADAAAATTWMRTAPEGDTGTAATIEVSRESPLPADPRATEMILHLEAGRRLGPISAPPGVLVFVKLGTETEPAPYLTVAEAIHARIVRAKLDATERKLAGEWASRHPIEDHLHPEEFGLDGPVARPWLDPAVKAGEGRSRPRSGAAGRTLCMK